MLLVVVFFCNMETYNRLKKFHSLSQQSIPYNYSYTEEFHHFFSSTFTQTVKGLKLDLMF